MCNRPCRLALAALLALSAEGLSLASSGTAAQRRQDRANDGHDKGGHAADGAGKDGLTPKQRERAHLARFEKDFTVELNMTDAQAHGLAVGMQLDTDTDFEPVSVLKIRKNGLLEVWNRANPDRAVHVGDEIMKVNDILWHHNTQTFGERIKGQFLASKERKKGAKNILSLSIQRPRREKRTRFPSQREDLRRLLYSKEFVAEIPLPARTGVQESLSQAMGWKLNSTVDWEPVSIEKLRGTGLVASFNYEHPDSKILAGDEILQVNHIQWHHSAAAFVDRLKAQFAAGQRNGSALQLHIRRPRTVKDVPGEQVYTKQFLVALNLKDAKPLGWRLNASDDADPVTVEKISAHGVLDNFNKANLASMVQTGDTLLKVNNMAWKKNSKTFIDRVNQEFEQSRPRKGRMPDGPLTLLLQRRLVQPIQKEWSVTMTASEGQILGWQLSSSDNEFPVTVSKIRSSGLVALHNQKHPEAKIMNGDVIVKANSVLWRQNSTAFLEGLAEEFSRASATGGEITFFLRRPVGVRGESEPAETRPFFKEFSAKLPMDSGDGPGWQLSADNATGRVSIAKIRSTGSVHAWNEANPLDEIQVGDVIAKVNNVLWHGDPKVFLNHMNSQIEAARKGQSQKGVTLLLQRPWRLDGSFGGGTGADDGDDVVGGGEDDTTGAEE